MGIPSRFIVKRVENRKRRFVEANREPRESPGLGDDQIAGLRKKARNIFFTALLGF